jgi:hypothetical protein
MSDLGRIEYAELRATIRQRGTLRIWLFLAGAAAWGGLVLLMRVAGSTPGPEALVPLLALAAASEAVYAVHTGVERIGRFVQVHYEHAAPLPAASAPAPVSGDSQPAPCWEATSMMYARRFPGSGPDPLFIRWFSLATLLDFLVGPDLGVGAGWVLLSLVAHAAYGWRLWRVHKSAAGQRAADLEKFTRLRTEGA